MMAFPKKKEALVLKRMGHIDPMLHITLLGSVWLPSPIFAHASALRAFQTLTSKQHMFRLSFRYVVCYPTRNRICSRTRPHVLILAKRTQTEGKFAGVRTSTTSEL